MARRPDTGSQLGVMPHGCSSENWAKSRKPGPNPVLCRAGYQRALLKPSMFQIRIHGRGGQGVVTAAELLSLAAFLEGKHAQAFPSFGSERMGAPVMAFCRIDDKPIRLREPVTSPNA